MIKSIISFIFILLVIFLFTSSLNIQIKPFQINLPNWRIGLGVILILLGSCLLIAGGEYKSNQINKESKL